MDLTIKIAAQSSKGYKNYTHIMKECTQRKKVYSFGQKTPKEWYCTIPFIRLLQKVFCSLAHFMV